MMKDLTQRWRRSAASVRARKVVANKLDFMMHQYQFTSCCSSVVVYDESLVHYSLPSDAMAGTTGTGFRHHRPSLRCSHRRSELL